MFRRKRILLISSSVVLLCLALIVGATFALFTEEARITNHLRAGHLDATLVRHSYEYTALDGQGKMVKHTSAGGKTIDFTDANAENFFGFNEDITLVPGSYFQAEFTLGNKGTTAYAYRFSFDVDATDDTANGYEYSATFASQLEATIYAVDAQGNTTKIAYGKLNQPLTYTTAANQLFGTDCVIVNGQSSAKFIVNVTFVSDANNDAVAQDQVWFDFVVDATQYATVTEAPAGQ